MWPCQRVRHATVAAWRRAMKTTVRQARPLRAPLVALVISLIGSPAPFAQEISVLPSAETMQPHSNVDVSTLPTAGNGAPAGPRLEGTPLTVRDAQAPSEGNHMIRRLLSGCAIAQAVSPGAAGAAEGVPSDQSEPPPGGVTVGVYDPAGQSPPTISWPPYPAPPPPGFHWQHSGSPAIKLDPATRQPLPDQWTGAWVLVRDGYTMPKMR